MHFVTGLTLIVLGLLGLNMAALIGEDPGLAPLALVLVLLSLSVLGAAIAESVILVEAVRERLRL